MVRKCEMDRDIYLLRDGLTKSFTLHTHFLTLLKPCMSDLDQLQKWETMCDMEFNPSKCVAIHITRAKRFIKSQYSMHSQILDTVDTAHYLGVDSSSNLNFKQHINQITCTSNANRTLGFLKRNIRVKNPCVREAAYQTLLRPQVEYASTIWSPYTKQGISKVEMVQRRAIRWTLYNYSPRSSVTEIQHELGWRSLEQRQSDATSNAVQNY